jgi:hypothetical protein
LKVNPGSSCESLLGKLDAVLVFHRYR